MMSATTADAVGLWKRLGNKETRTERFYNLRLKDGKLGGELLNPPFASMSCSLDLKVVADRVDAQRERREAVGRGAEEAVGDDALCISSGNLGGKSCPGPRMTADAPDASTATVSAPHRGDESPLPPGALRARGLLT